MTATLPAWLLRDLAALIYWDEQPRVQWRCPACQRVMEFTGDTQWVECGGGWVYDDAGQPVGPLHPIADCYPVEGWEALRVRQAAAPAPPEERDVSDVAAPPGPRQLAGPTLPVQGREPSCGALRLIRRMIVRFLPGRRASVGPPRR